MKREGKFLQNLAANTRLRGEQQTEELQKEISKWQASALEWVEKCAQLRDQYSEYREKYWQASDNALQQTTAPLVEKPSRITRGNVIHLLRSDNR